MPNISHFIAPDGLICVVRIGLKAEDFVKLEASGLPYPASFLCRALIDTGSDITSVSSSVIQRLGLIEPWHSTSTHTASGPTEVDLFQISLSILDEREPTLPLTIPTLLVMRLFALPANIDVLIGLDVIRTCRLVVDGPANAFSLDW